MKPKLKKIVASLIDRENIVFEIYQDEYLFAEISNEPNQEMTMEFYSHPMGNSWQVNVDDLLLVLNDAKENLLSS